MTNFNEEQVEVEYRDTNKREYVTVKRLPLGQFYVWVNALPERNVPRLTEIALQKPAGWCDSLTDASFARISKAAFAVNFQRAMTLSDQGEEFVAGVILAEAVRVDRNLKNVETLGLDLTSLLPPPPPSAAAVETQKPSSASSPTSSSSTGSPNSAEISS